MGAKVAANQTNPLTDHVGVRVRASARWVMEARRERTISARRAARPQKKRWHHSRPLFPPSEKEEITSEVKEGIKRHFM